MKELTKIEEILLLAIWKLKGQAYGVRIRRYLSTVMDRDFTYGNLYSALHQLALKGYVQKTIGQSAPGRGGRRRIYYTVSTDGLEALEDARRLNLKLWAEVPNIAFRRRES